MMPVARRLGLFAAIAVIAAVAALPPSVARAQGLPNLGPDRGVPIDRIVAVVGTRAILLSEVLEEVNTLRAQGQQHTAAQALIALVDGELDVPGAHGQRRLLAGLQARQLRRRAGIAVDQRQRAFEYLVAQTGEQALFGAGLGALLGGRVGQIGRAHV